MTLTAFGHIVSVTTATLLRNLLFGLAYLRHESCIKTTGVLAETIRFT